MAGPYVYDPNRAPQAESTFTAPAPPNYATFVGGYPQQQQAAEVCHHNRDEDGESDLEEARIPVDHMNVRSS